MKFVSIIATGFMLVSGAVSAATVNFSTNFSSALTEGTAIWDQSAGLFGSNGRFDFGDGLTGRITSANLGSNATGDIVVFDTNSGTASVANDPDLESPFTNVDSPFESRSFGNALILDEAGQNSDPDDASRGGSIVFTFDVPIFLTSVTLLDGNDNSPTGGSIYLGGSSIAFATNLGGGDNEYQVTTIGQIVTSFAVDFAGSGAIGEFSASVVPLPASVTLLLAAIAGLGFVGTRRRQEA